MVSDEMLYGYVCEKHGAFYPDTISEPGELTPVARLSDLEAALRAGGEPVAFMHADHIEQYKNKTTDGIFWANRERTEFYTVPLYIHHAPSCERELAEARERLDRKVNEKIEAVKALKVAEAERDALAAYKARLVAAGTALADQADHCLMGYSAYPKPDLSVAMAHLRVVVDGFRAALASTPAPADKEPPSIDYLRGQIGEILALELDADEGGRALSQAVERILSLIATAPSDKAEARREALEEAAALEVPFPKILGEVLRDSPHAAIERYRAAIRALANTARREGE